MMTQEEALRVLKTGANVFLTGEPGSGKTHTVNTYVSWLRERGIEPAITASTGIAATHIGGFTIHSWSGIGVRRFLSEEDIDAISQNKNVVRRVTGATTLIIDEVSMLSSGTLSMVDAVCREVRRTSRPFGGLQVVLVGDFFQLPPISRRGDPTKQIGHPMSDLFGGGDDEKEDGFAFIAPVWRAANPLVCYLSEQYRQEDAAFLKLLLALRQGAPTEHEQEILQSRFSAEPPDDVTKLYTHNADVDTINDTELEKIPGKKRVFTMQSRGPEKLIAGLIRGCLSPETLVLKEGARVMFTKNDIARGRYVNGTLGTIVGFASPSGYPLVKIHDGRELEAEPDEWRIEDDGRVLASITQVPLRLAWAITVHKSQGMSLDGAHMDLSGAFEYGQGYVALSRVRTLEGLTLAGLNERALQVHPTILEKDAEFRAFSQAARAEFTNMPSGELSAMHAAFVKACGGSEPAPSNTIPDVGHRVSKRARAAKPRGHAERGAKRWRATFELLAGGKGLAEVAKERGRKTETILKHLERLAEKEPPLDAALLAHLTDGIEDNIERAIAVFKEQEHAYLKPAHDALGGEISYDILRLARLLGGFPTPPPREKHSDE